MSSDRSTERPVPAAAQPAKIETVAPARYRVEAFPEVAALARRRALLDERNQRPLEPLPGPNGAVIPQGEREVLNFTTNDYLGLASDPRVNEAARAAVRHYGASASASRPVSGEIPLYRELETRLADFLGTESAVLFVSGHATAVTALEILFAQGDLILVDERSRHGNVVEGAFVSGAEVMSYPHHDHQALDRILDEVRPRYKKVLIALEAVSAIEGGVPPLPRFVDLKQRYNTFLLVDEDNSFGVLGTRGRGLCERFGTDPRQVDIFSGNIDKALASCGGFVAGDRALVDYMKHHATSLIFAVSIAPMSTAAASKALEVLVAEPQRATRVKVNADELRYRLRQMGFDLGRSAEGPIVPVRLAEGRDAAEAARRLLERGIAVEHRSAAEMEDARGRLILFATAAHTREQIERAAGALAEVLDAPGAPAAEGLLAVEAEIARWADRAAGRVARHPSELASKRPAYAGDVPARFYRVTEFPEYQNMVRRLAAVTEDKVLYFKPHDGIVSDTICVKGRRMTNYSSFNYLGLSGHPEVIAAAQRAIDVYGSSASASRRTSGTLRIHRELEQELADFIGTEDAVVFDAGHNTNVSSIGHLFGKGDLVLHDVLSHNSLIQGALLAGAHRRPFPHNDYETADAMLASLRHEYRRVGLVIEGVYSQDGDFPDLRRFIEVKDRHHALLFVDEAHSIGVLGATGAGVAAHFGVDPAEIEILMGTISKAVGTSGGYITGSRALIDYMREAPCLRSSVSVSPAVAAAALEAVRVIRRQPEKVKALHERADLFRELARQQGLDTGLSNGSGIIPVMTYSSELAYRLTYALLDKGITVHPVTYPVVPEGAARLRFLVTSDHSEEQIRTTIEELGRVARLHREEGASGAR